MKYANLKLMKLKIVTEDNSTESYYIAKID